MQIITKRERPASTKLIETDLAGTFEVSGRLLMNVEMTLYPDYGRQCVSGDTNTSRFSWDGDTNQVHVDAHWSNATHSRKRDLSLSGPPHALEGQATLGYLGGMVGELKVAFPRK